MIRANRSNALACSTTYAMCSQNHFFPLGPEETIFHAFCCRLKSLEADIERDTVWSEWYLWMINACGMERAEAGWSVGEAYMVSLPLEFVIIPTGSYPPAGPQIPQGVPCCTRGRVVYFTTWTHCSVFLYARLFSKLMALSRGSLLYEHVQFQEHTCKSNLIVSPTKLT